jgi:6-phosphofructokinase 2
MADIVAICMSPSMDISTSVERVMPIRKLRCGAAKRDPCDGGVNVVRVVRRFGTGYPTGGLSGQVLRRLVDQELERTATSTKNGP